MVDTYANWAQLAAANTLGVDYRLPIRTLNSNTVHIAIHGSSIEPGSSEMASACAAMSYQNYYALEGIKSSGNSTLHITSTNYDEPKGLAIVGASKNCISYHGYTGTAGVSATFVGGLDTTRRDAIIAALQASGFTASNGTQELNGDDPANITNKTLNNAGVQIEMSNALRQSFFTSNDTSRANRETGVRTATFDAYVRAIFSVTNSLEARPQQTLNYDLNEPLSTDLMSDFETWINSNWTKLSAVNVARSVTALPTSGNYAVGDRIVHTTLKSTFICIANDPLWGIFWKPVHDAMGPWQNLPASILLDGSFSVTDATRPLQVAFDNQGNMYWRGILKCVSGPFVKGLLYSPFNILPNGMQPRENMNFMLGHDALTVNTGLTQWEGVNLYVPHNVQVSNTETYLIGLLLLGGNGTGSVQNIYFDGQVQWAVGTGVFET